MSPSGPFYSPEDRCLAANPCTGPDQLRDLGKSTDEKVLVYLSENRSTPLDLLIELADHQSDAVRLGLGDNPSTPIHVLLKLTKDESSEVRFALAENHNLPHPVLVALVKDENPWIRVRAEKTLGTLGLPTVIEEEVKKDTSQIRVLVAEDNAHIRFLISRILDKDPEIKVVVQAEDGRATVEQTFLSHPDVILMDIAMPNMSGVVATEIIKKQAPKTKVIMVTGSDTEDDITEAFRAGADGYFLKSTPFSELPRCIKSVYAQASWLDPGISTTILKRCFTGTTPRGKGEVLSLPSDHDVALSVISTLIESMLEDEVFEDVYNRVDKFLYAAKQNGRNR
ncbi:MAG: response regulator, partial [Cyanobacteria bacterium]|nr:response regulator [Cyanobacteriota bacterium]